MRARASAYFRSLSDMEEEPPLEPALDLSFEEDDPAETLLLLLRFMIFILRGFEPPSNGLAGMPVAEDA